MKAFVWVDIDKVTDNYHPGGGLLVVAESLEAARALVAEQVRSDCAALTDEPDRQFDAVAEAPFHVVFRDAGCC